MNRPARGRTLDLEPGQERSPAQARPRRTTIEFWPIDSLWVWRLAAALLFGSLLGAERECRHQDAGLRTLTLISLGSCAFSVIGVWLTQQPADADSILRLDPSRIPAYTIVGIGFLGAGPIITQRSEVRGLTTAASIWATAGIGIACGLGLFALAAVLTGLILLTNVALTPISNWFERRGTWSELGLRCPDDSLSEHGLRSALRGIPHDIVERRVDGQRICYRVRLLTSHRHAHGTIRNLLELDFIEAWDDTDGPSTGLPA